MAHLRLPIPPASDLDRAVEVKQSFAARALKEQRWLEGLHLHLFDVYREIQETWMRLQTRDWPDAFRHVRDALWKHSGESEEFTDTHLPAAWLAILDRAETLYFLTMADIYPVLYAAWEHIAAQVEDEYPDDDFALSLREPCASTAYWNGCETWKACGPSLRAKAKPKPTQRGGDANGD